MRQMTEVGACLEEDEVMDISAEQLSAADEAPIEGVAPLPSVGTASQAAPVRGYYIINRVMDRVVAPEVKDRQGAATLFAGVEESWHRHRAARGWHSMLGV